MVPTLIFNILLLFLFKIAHSEEILLSNIEQLTSPSLGFTKAGEAYFSSDSQKISFQTVPIGEEDYQIFLMDLQTKAITKISHNMGACTCSYFHPNSKKIIFAASPEMAQKYIGIYKWDLTPDMNIYETNLDGSELKPLTSGFAYHAECAYSPDGLIVFASNADGAMNIYTMNSDGTNVQQITHTTHCYNGGPFFSPDGKQIIFRADRKVPDLLQIYIMDIDGNNLVRVTNDKEVNWAPFWHSSGKAVAYTTSIHGHHNSQIYLLSLENGKMQRITYTPTFNGLPSFNQDGSKMSGLQKEAKTTPPKYLLPISICTRRIYEFSS